MKLKDKKTDKPLTLKLIQTDCECLTEHEVDTLYGEPITLETLNKYCEDYEEPKEYWYISEQSAIIKMANNPKDIPNFVERCLSIGNLFETKEEAEQAVEKLKAWKRLKDTGFRFNAWYGGSKDISFSIPQEIIDTPTAKDLDLLFGGEEC